MGKPFCIKQPPATNANAKTEPVAPVAGKAIAQSSRNGDPLPTPAQGTPGHQPSIPWPEAKGVEHKPFKNTK